MIRDYFAREALVYVNYQRGADDMLYGLPDGTRGDSNSCVMAKALEREYNMDAIVRVLDKNVEETDGVPSPLRWLYALSAAWSFRAVHADLFATMFDLGLYHQYDVARRPLNQKKSVVVKTKVNKVRKACDPRRMRKRQTLKTHGRREQPHSASSLLSDLVILD